VARLRPATGGATEQAAALASSSSRLLQAQDDGGAARYGMSESNVKINIHRGLKALASIIGRNSDK
jgi:hypothetical protein